MRTIFKVLFFDVIWASISIAIDALLVHSFFSDEHFWWGLLTSIAMALPGCLEILYLLRCEMGLCNLVLWFIFFGPWLFPISLVVWHLVQICQGEEKFHEFKTMARSRVLSTLSVLTKSSMQLILQVTILMITWKSNNSFYLSYQLTSVLVNTVNIAKNCCDHHYFESAGKRNHVQEQPPICHKITRTIFNILHIICRGFVIALLASYFHFLTIAVLALMVLANFVTSVILIKTEISKHFWTSFASILLPVCFISRNDLVGEYASRKNTRELFSKYYIWNSVIFLFIIGIIGPIATFCVIQMTDTIHFTDTNLPFLSDSPYDLTLWKSLVIWFFLSLLHVIFVSTGECISWNMEDYEIVSRA